MLQGLLLMQTAFSVFVPSMVALHCFHTQEKGMWCEGEPWVHRAKALATCSSPGGAPALLIFTVALFLALRHTCGEEGHMPLGLGQGDIEEGLPGASLLLPPIHCTWCLSPMCQPRGRWLVVRGRQRRGGCDDRGSWPGPDVERRGGAPQKLRQQLCAGPATYNYLGCRMTLQ